MEGPRLGSVGNVPPLEAGFGCSEGCVFAHSAFACWIRDSWWSHSFCLACNRSRDDIETWL